MPEEIKTLEIGEATSEKKIESPHIPSTIQADTLFTFTSELTYLIPYIEKSCIYPRYCEENIEYLNIERIKSINIPMKCFCDINLHRISVHLDWYGFYGLAFSKEWGMKKGIQPIQYMNPESKLCKDFSIAFSQALKDEPSETGDLKNLMKSYMLHELMYYKPYEGNMKNRTTKKIERKCFTDECEWRYVPDLSSSGFQQVYYDPIMMNAAIMDDISNSLTRVPNIALDFDYSDIKHIIIETSRDFLQLVTAIENLSIDKNTKYELISKIIIWDKSKGDF